jgi:hypothetical protein
MPISAWSPLPEPPLASPRPIDTQVLATATAAKEVREGIDFFPLTVDVEERCVRRRQDPRLVLPS